MSREQDAARWFARMRGPDAATARVEFETWYADPQNAAAYDHLVRSWDQAKFLANMPTGRGRNLELARPGGQRRSFALGVALVAAVCLCLFLAIPHLQQTFAPKGSVQQEIASTGDTPRTITLVDGSRITLDRASRLVIDFGADARRLRLEAGRARFEVAHERARAFIVEAGAGSVIAHGTVFDVAIAPGGVEIVLLQGVVEARGRAGGTESVRRLVPGQKVVATAGRLTDPVVVSARDTQWIEPMIEFDAVPLAEAVAEFNRMGERKIVLDPAISPRLRVTGAFRRDDPETFATTLAATFGLSVQREDSVTLKLAAEPARRDEKKP